MTIRWANSLRSSPAAWPRKTDKVSRLSVLTCHRHEHRWIGQIALGQDGQHFVADVGLIEFLVDLIYAQDHLLLDLEREGRRSLN